jgi:hypothetical protein
MLLDEKIADTATTGTSLPVAVVNDNQGNVIATDTIPLSV